ncbi:MAG: hypothetical protein EZS28_039622 [Streblomastix strix]|uniref:Uncharacterized protein n=1 Tax=Streblomastix strix TaxID=222440 RepID=A0A5J4U4F3_9EUKA|nr:MAG: hypothetical protein EZS28_039622 [Streblomastix strix]
MKHLTPQKQMNVFVNQVNHNKNVHVLKLEIFVMNVQIFLKLVMIQQLIQVIFLYQDVLVMAMMILKEEQSVQLQLNVQMIKQIRNAYVLQNINLQVAFVHNYIIHKNVFVIKVQMHYSHIIFAPLQRPVQDHKEMMNKQHKDNAHVDLDIIHLVVFAKIQKILIASVHLILDLYVPVIGMQGHETIEEHNLVI